MKSTAPVYSLDPATNRTMFRFLLALAWKYHWSCAKVLLLQILLLSIGLCGLGLMGVGVDFIRSRVSAPGTPPKPPHWPLGLQPPDGLSDLQVLALIAGVVLLFGLLRGFLNYIYTVEVTKFVQGQLVVDLRSQVYAKMQRLSFRFFDAHASASIINRVTVDVQSVRLFVDGVVIPCIVLILSLLVYLFYMASISVPLTAACLAFTPALWYTTRRFSQTMRPFYRRVRDLMDNLVTVLNEHLNGVSVVKGFALESAEIAKFNRANDAVLQAQQVVFRKISLFNPLVTMISQLSIVILLGYGGWLVVQYERAPDAISAARAGLSVGQLLVFSGLLQQFSGQIANIANIANSIQQSLIASQRVYEVLSAPVEIESPPNPVKLPHARGAVAFEGVTFGYTAADPMLQDINLNVPPGACIAILGATGSGKSTLMSLIPRFYDPVAGRICIDGHDVRELDLADLRHAVGMVFQESFLFSTTVAANIAFGNPNASQAAIEKAARIAAAHDFICRLPKGYDTLLHEGGGNLSGGQRQRIAIARAILLEPSILLLDDPTAAIDAHTEHEILQAMEGAMEGRTTFVVAHRLSTLRRADRVIVLDHGRLVEQGSHAELMARGGLYREIVNIQIADAEGTRT